MKTITFYLEDNIHEEINFDQKNDNIYSSKD